MNAIIVLLIILGLLMFAVGRGEGLRAYFSFFINFLLIFLCIWLLAIGFPPILITLVIGTSILAVTIFLGSQDDLATQSAFYASFVVLILLVVIIMPIEAHAFVQGFSSENGEEIEGFSLQIGISLVQISSATAILSTLGAISEAAIAISSGLSEIITKKPEITPEALFTDGQSIGRQIIGTALNTLFFSFFGGFLALFIWFMNLKYTFAQIINNKIFVGELLMNLFALIGVVLIIPLTSFVVSWLHGHHQSKA